MSYLEESLEGVTGALARILNEDRNILVDEWEEVKSRNQEIEKFVYLAKEIITTYSGQDPLVVPEEFSIYLAKNEGLEFLLHNRDKINIQGRSMERILELLTSKRSGLLQNSLVSYPDLDKFLGVLKDLYYSDKNHRIIKSAAEKFGTFVSYSLFNILLSRNCPDEIELDLFDTIPLFDNYTWPDRTEKLPKKVVLKVRNPGPHSLRNAILPDGLIVDVEDSSYLILKGVKKVEAVVNPNYISKDIHPPVSVEEEGGKKRIVWSYSRRRDLNLARKAAKIVGYSYLGMLLPFTSLGVYFNTLCYMDSECYDFWSDIFVNSLIATWAVDTLVFAIPLTIALSWYVSLKEKIKEVFKK